MLNENFWDPEKNSYISSCIKEFIADEPVLEKLDSVKLGELETKLFALLQKVKEPIYREVDEEYLREDVSDKIKEWCGKKGEFVLSLFPFNEIKELDSHWNEVMELAKIYGFICQAFGGTATLATHKNQVEAFGEEQYARRQREMFGRKIKLTEVQK